MSTDMPVPGPSINVPSGTTGALAAALRNAVPYTTFLLEDGVYRVSAASLTMFTPARPVAPAPLPGVSNGCREPQAGECSMACLLQVTRMRAAGYVCCTNFTQGLGSGECLLT